MKVVQAHQHNEAATPADMQVRVFFGGLRFRTLLLAQLESAAQEAELLIGEAVTLLYLYLAPASVSAIANVAALRRNGSSVLVERLRRRGLVETKRQRRDRRVVEVSLSTPGRSLVERALIPHFQKTMRAQLAPLSSSEQELFLSLLDRLSRDTDGPCIGSRRLTAQPTALPGDA